MKKQTEYETKITGFLGKKGETFLLSEIDMKNKKAMFREKGTNKFITMSFNDFELYEKKKLLKKFNI